MIYPNYDDQTYTPCHRIINCNCSLTIDLMKMTSTDHVTAYINVHDISDKEQYDFKSYVNKNILYSFGPFPNQTLKYWKNVSDHDLYMLISA